MMSKYEFIKEYAKRAVTQRVIVLAIVHEVLKELDLTKVDEQELTDRIVDRYKDRPLDLFYQMGINSHE